MKYWITRDSVGRAICAIFSRSAPLNGSETSGVVDWRAVGNGHVEHPQADAATLKALGLDLRPGECVEIELRVLHRRSEGA